MSAALRMHAPTSLDIYRGRCVKLSTFQNGLAGALAFSRPRRHRHLPSRQGGPTECGSGSIRRLRVIDAALAPLRIEVARICCLRSAGNRMCGAPADLNHDQQLQRSTRGSPAE